MALHCRTLLYVLAGAMCVPLAAASISIVTGAEDCFLCGTPSLTSEQLASIDPTTVENIRQTIMDNNNEPILMNDPRPLDPSLTQPLVELTETQRLTLEFKYGDTVQQRKKRAPGGSLACATPSQNLVLFAIDSNTDVVSCEATNLMTSTACDPTPTGGCESPGNCCLEDICVPVYCINFSQGRPMMINAMIKRCTCCNV